MTPEESGRVFAERAQGFLKVLDTGEAKTQEGLRTLATSLAELYAAGLQLPVEDPPEEGSTGPALLRAPPQMAFEGTRAYYRHADPGRPGTEEVGDLGEDLEDLFAELVRGLSYYGDGTPAGAQRARLHWRRSLPHWGHHVVEALRAIHYRLHGLPGTAGEH